MHDEPHAERLSLRVESPVSTCSTHQALSYSSQCLTPCVLGIGDMAKGIECTYARARINHGSSRCGIHFISGAPSPFVWLWLVVKDRKFLVGTVFFSHTNQLAILLHEPVNRTGCNKSTAPPQPQFHVSSSDGSQRPLWLWAGGAEGRDRARQARQPPAFFNGHEREGHAGGRYIHCLIATSVSLKLAVAVLLRTASTDCWRMYV